ncbi:hypothetical protein K440DRAFT_619649 [Wilcoxina mikolae CBS 423.85]|nr:hypothetical protein K440DRAFT_619649 [Wilcoxina mikolae CBS 423.85]
MHHPSEWWQRLIGRLLLLLLLLLLLVCKRNWFPLEPRPSSSSGHDDGGSLR